MKLTNLCWTLLFDHKGKITLRASTGVWKASLFIIAIEFSERLSYFGIATSLIIYLTKVIHQDLKTAARSVNYWSGVTTVMPIFGGFLADAYLGRFNAVLGSSIVYLLLSYQTAQGTGRATAMVKLAILAILLMLSATATMTKAQPACASKLVPCVDYLNSTAKPPDTCCNPIKEAVTNEPPCLYNLYNTPGLLASFNISIDQALRLLWRIAQTRR